MTDKQERHHLYLHTRSTGYQTTFVLEPEYAAAYVKKDIITLADTLDRKYLTTYTYVPSARSVEESKRSHLYEGIVAYMRSFIKFTHETGRCYGPARYTLPPPTEQSKEDVELLMDAMDMMAKTHEILHALFNRLSPSVSIPVGDDMVNDPEVQAHLDAVYGKKEA